MDNDKKTSAKPIAAAAKNARNPYQVRTLTIKPKGYHFEHNYGHGKRHLSSSGQPVILAFLVHTTLEWMDRKYQLLRQKLPSRKRLFNDIRTLTSYLCFDHREALMDFMLQSFDRPPSKPQTG